jgi:hypothetical protein
MQREGVNFMMAVEAGVIEPDFAGYVKPSGRLAVIHEICALRSEIATSYLLPRRPCPKPFRN